MVVFLRNLVGRVITFFYTFKKGLLKSLLNSGLKGPLVLKNISVIETYTTNLAKCFVQGLRTSLKIRIVNEK